MSRRDTVYLLSTWELPRVIHQINCIFGLTGGTRVRLPEPDLAMAHAPLEGQSCLN